MDLHQLGELLGVPDLTSKLHAVEQRIDGVLELDDEAHRSALRRVIGSGGKRLRPAFTIACAELLGTWDDRVVDAAAAVELVQIGSLVHDDILDGADTRRGTPTINAVEGIEVAIVAGDLVLARAGELACGISAEAGALVTGTIARLCRGQLVEMTDQHDPQRSIDRHLSSIAGKTAALFESSCRLGALCARAADAAVDDRAVDDRAIDDRAIDDAVTDALGAHGRAFGMAFQLLDDVLDLVGDAHRLGKPVGVDIEAGVYTLPVLHVLGGPGGAALEERLRIDATAAGEQVVRDGGVEAATKLMADFAQQSAGALTPLVEAGFDPSALRAFSRTYLDWALEEFTRR